MSMYISDYIHIYIYTYKFIGSASAADLFFCISVCIIYGFWADLVCGIGFVAQFGCGLHISKVDLLYFEILVFLQSC